MHFEKLFTFSLNPSKQQERASTRSLNRSDLVADLPCPACHKHCASGLSLRDDPKYDALIEALYPNIARCGEEELAFDDEDPNGNQQVVRFMELAVETYRCLPLCA